MKNAISLMLALAPSLATVGLAAGEIWMRKADMTTARRSLSTTTLNGKIYAIGGNPGASGGLSTVEEYDPAMDTWTTKAPMSRARGGLSITAVMGKIYAIGGMTHPSASFTTVEEYDPSTDTWTTKSPMPTPRFGLSVSAVNGKIYAIGGQGAWPDVTSRVEEYDPVTDTWTRKADMPTARCLFSTSVVSGRIYAIGGTTTYPNVTSRVEEYDPATDTWTRKVDMPTARAQLATCASSGRVYAIGGAPHQDQAPIPVVEVYNPAINTWTIEPNMPTARSFLAASAVNGRIYAIGGTTGAFPWPIVATVEAYDPGLPPPDFSGDYMIDMDDLLILIECWGQDDPICDIAPLPLGDGIVDVADLELFMGYWQQELDDPRLLAHWKLDETEGVVAADSTGTCSGTVCGEAVWQPDGGAVDGALALDGIDDSVATDFVLDPAEGPFSVYAWIRCGSPGQAIVSQVDGETWLGTDPVTGSLMTELKGIGRDKGMLHSETVVTDGSWYRVGLVWEGDKRSLYADDIVIAEDTQAGGPGACRGGLNIGCGASLNPGTFFSGLIDDIRIYDRAVRP